MEWARFSGGLVYDSRQPKTRRGGQQPTPRVGSRATERG
jgi:hypothetical protein